MSSASLDSYTAQLVETKAGDMNWVGGVRSRLRLQNERKQQKVTVTLDVKMLYFFDYSCKQSTTSPAGLWALLWRRRNKA